MGMEKSKVKSPLSTPAQMRACLARADAEEARRLRVEAAIAGCSDKRLLRLLNREWWRLYFAIEARLSLEAKPARTSGMGQLAATAATASNNPHPVYAEENEARI